MIKNPKRLAFIRHLRESSFIESFSPRESDVILGKNVKIKKGAIIGTDGFGYEPDEKDILIKFPHYGKVRIEDNCDIGSCYIDRGNLTDTVIGEGTKIDNMVHIGHNAKIGKNCLIVAGTVIGGGSIIGDNTFIGMNVSVIDHVNIGNNCTIGAGSVVTRDIPSNSKAYGVPAKVK